jgi:propanol-preferring alcohol dehydrogenase
MTTTETMRAAVVHNFRAPLTIDRLPIPTPGPGQVLIKMEASGVCHTDLHAADGDWPIKPTPPFVPGHEGVGKGGRARVRSDPPRHRRARPDGLVGQRLRDV